MTMIFTSDARIVKELKSIESLLDDLNATQSAILAEEKKQSQALADILDALVSQPGPPVVLELTQILEGKEIQGMVNLTDIQKYSIRVKDELDAKGKPVAAAGPFKSALSNSALGTLTDDADGLGTTFAVGDLVGVDLPATGTITLTDSTNSLQGVSDFTINPSAATQIELTEGAPTNQ